VNLNYLSLNNEGGIFSVSWTLLFSVFVLLYPPALAIFCIYNREKLADPKFLLRYGSLYEGLDISRASAVVYFPAFTFRRLLFALTAVYLTDSSIFQV